MASSEARRGGSSVEFGLPNLEQMGGGVPEWGLRSFFVETGGVRVRTNCQPRRVSDGEACLKSVSHVGTRASFSLD